MRQRRVRQSETEHYGFERIPVEPLAVALVLLACAQSFGAIIVILELLILGAILVIRWRDVGAVVRTGLPLLALPLFAVISALWSELPAVTVRYGLQLVITALIGIVIARSVPVTRIAPIVFLGTAAATLIGLALGRTGPSPEGPVLIGLAGSKNQMGYITLFLMISALAVLLERTQTWWLRALAATSLVPAMHLLITGNVMTALVLAVVALVATGLLLLFGVLRPQARKLALLSAFLLSLGAMVSVPQITALGDQFRAETLGKDDRLTGRTLLWEAAEGLVAERPLSGHGYRAIWLGEAGTGLLARFGLRDGRTFNFHNTVIELRADLGLGGVALLALTFLVGWGRLFLLLIDRVTPARIFLALALLTITARMFTELVIAPFLLDTIMLFAVLAAIARARTAAPAAAPSMREPLLRPRAALTEFGRLNKEGTTAS